MKSQKLTNGEEVETHNTPANSRYTSTNVTHVVLYFHIFQQSRKTLLALCVFISIPAKKKNHLVGANITHLLLLNKKEFLLKTPKQNSLAHFKTLVNVILSLRLQLLRNKYKSNYKIILKNPLAPDCNEHEHAMSGFFGHMARTFVKVKVR